jgi:hypothetical protein
VLIVRVLKVAIGLCSPSEVSVKVVVKRLECVLWFITCLKHNAVLIVCVLKVAIGVCWPDEVSEKEWCTEVSCLSIRCKITASALMQNRWVIHAKVVYCTTLQWSIVSSAIVVKNAKNIYEIIKTGRNQYLDTSVRRSMMRYQGFLFLLYLHTAHYIMLPPHGVLVYTAYSHVCGMGNHLRTNSCVVKCQILRPIELCRVCVLILIWLTVCICSI